jgi:hypothetical protein
VTANAVDAMNAYTSALVDFVEASHEQLDRSLYPDDIDCTLVVMSEAVKIVIGASRARFEKAGLSPYEARQRAVEMVAHALGDT